MTAPTLAAIAMGGHDLSVFCPRCRVTAPLDPLKLALAKDENRPITAFVFRCRRCGGPGDPIVTAPGN